MEILLECLFVPAIALAAHVRAGDRSAPRYHAATMVDEHGQPVASAMEVANLI
jgi:hypothetical protein